MLYKLRELHTIPPFDVKKGWEEFQRDYLPKAQKFSEEHKNIGLKEIEQFLKQLENKSLL